MNNTWSQSIERRKKIRAISGRNMEPMPFHRPMPFYYQLEAIVEKAVLLLIFLVGLVEAISWGLDRIQGL